MQSHPLPSPDEAGPSSRLLRPLAVVAVTVVQLSLELSPDPGARGAAMLVLLAGPGVLGYLWPGRAWLAGLVLGLAPAVAHAGFALAGIAPPGRTMPLEPGAVAGLAALAVPAVIAAFAGASTRRLTTGRRYYSDLPEDGPDTPRPPR